MNDDDITLADGVADAMISYVKRTVSAHVAQLETKIKNLEAQLAALRSSGDLWHTEAKNDGLPRH